VEAEVVAAGSQHWHPTCDFYEPFGRGLHDRLDLVSGFGSDDKFVVDGDHQGIVKAP
jgi:hypothetical protein